MVKKAVNIEVKVSLQLPFETKEIDSRYQKSHNLSAKKKKNKANLEYQDRDKDKVKSNNPSSINSQTQT